MLHKNLAPQDSHSPSQEQVENNTVSDIQALRCVTYTGIGALYPAIQPANPGQDIRGLTQSIIQAGSRGYILVYGLMYNVDTSAWTAGTSLYCGAGGALTSVSNGPQVANVIKQHATAGVIQVTCLDTPGALTANVMDTDSVNMDTAGLLIKSDVRISPAGPSAGAVKATTTIKTSPNEGVHVEYQTAAPTTNLTADTPNAVGAATTISRSDHTHEIDTGTPVSITPDLANAEGVSPNLARADHVHNVPAASAVGLDADSTNTEGVATSFARADHKHNIATAAPVTQTPDQVNAAGSSSSLARADHVHNIPADAPITTLSPATTNAEGTANSFARSDHTHAVAAGLVGDITAIQPDAAASAGTVDRFARADHRHAIDAAAPVNTGSANAEGSSTSFARADHVHNTVLSVTKVETTTAFSTTSTTDVIITGFTITPPAGTYILTCSLTSNKTAGLVAANLTFSLYLAGAQIPVTERNIHHAGNNQPQGGSTITTVTVNGSQTLDGRVRTSGGTVEVLNRSLIAVRIG